MSPNQAKQEAKRLANEGMKYTDIAKKLQEAGYLGRRGTPLTPVGVSQLLLRHGVRRRETAASQSGTGRWAPKPPRPAAGNGGGKLAAIRSILMLNEMHAEEKIALALLVLG